MEPVGVSRKWTVILASHTEGGESLLRSSGALHPIISILANPDIRHAGVADGRGDKCGKTHIFAAWVLAGLEG